jgi:hypothetical protein
MDFMNDNIYNGRRFRVLNVLDSYSRDFLGFEIEPQSIAIGYAGFWDGLPGSMACRK